LWSLKVLLNASQGVGQARDYCRNDLLGRALLRISAGNPIIGFLIAELLGLVGILGGCYIVSKQGDRPGAHFLPIYDARQLAIVLFVYIFVVPFVWGFYLRDLIAIPQTFQRLSASGAINGSEGSEEDQARQASVERFLRNNLGRFNHLSGAILTLVAIAEELRRKYEFVKKEAHTWAFTAPTVLRDVFGALLPLLPIIITYLLQILPLFPIFR
jgi:hypothetical protein